MPHSLELYQFAKAARFVALPVAGGLYDQDPELLDQWLQIMQIENDAERRRQEAEERKAKSQSRTRRR